MKKLMLATAMTLPFLTGCVVAVGTGGEDAVYSTSSSWQKQHKKNREKIAQLERGISYQDVMKKLGTPEFNELVKHNGVEYRVIFYPTNSIHSDGKMTKDECTPIVFANDELQGFGETAYNLIKGS